MVTHAVFEIPLGILGAWTDFELKGSRNNFSGLATDALVYFFGSQYGDGQSTHGRIGVTEAVYFTDDLAGTDHGGARRWRKMDMSRSLAEQRSSPSARVGGVVVVVPLAGNPNLSPNDTALRFVYQRATPTALEECWVPIVPKWQMVFSKDGTFSGGGEGGTGEGGGGEGGSGEGGGGEGGSGGGGDINPPPPDWVPSWALCMVTAYQLRGRFRTPLAIYYHLARPTGEFHLTRWKTPGTSPKVEWNPDGTLKSNDWADWEKWEYCGRFWPQHWRDYAVRIPTPFTWVIMPFTLKNATILPNGQVTGQQYYMDATGDDEELYIVSYIPPGGPTSDPLPYDESRIEWAMRASAPPDGAVPQFGSTGYGTPTGGQTMTQMLGPRLIYLPPQ
jgi:hypothetical protein